MEKEIQTCWKKAYMKAKVGGYEFKPIEAFEYCRTQMPSGIPLLEKSGYQTYVDTKILLAHLGMKDAEYQAQSSQLSTAQIKLNELFGSTFEMYLDVLNR